MTLSPAQRSAAESPAAHTLVSACPGAGKSRTLVARVQWLIEQGTPPERIAAITFTQSGAKVMQERLPGVDMGWCGTLHALCLKLIRQHHALAGYPAPPAVLSEELAEQTAREVYDEAKGDAKKTTVQGVTFAQMLEQISKDPPLKGQRRVSTMENLTSSYFLRLREQNLVDFDGILREGRNLIKTHPEIISFRHLACDECQDQARIDWQIYHEMPVETRWMCGDFDQCIMQFRGSDPEQMLEYAKTATVFNLSANYRSVPEVCTAAMTLIKHNANRIPNDMFSANGGKGSVTVTEHPDEASELAAVAKAIRSVAEAQRVMADDENPYGDMAVLLRTNWLVKRFTLGLESYSIPVSKPERGEDRPPDWRVAKALVAALADPDNEALVYHFARDRFGKESADTLRTKSVVAMRPLTLPATILPPVTLAQAMDTVGISEASKELVRGYAAGIQEGYDLSALSLAIHAELPQKMTPGVTIKTLHAVKGMEFSHCFIPCMEQGTIPSKQSLPDGLQEERRLLFVGITRSKVSCSLSWSRQRTPSMPSWAKPAATEPSQFLKELQL